MGKKHFLLFDFLLPLAGICIIGKALAGRFAAAILQRVDAVKAFGIGYAFAHSGLRASLLHYSWLAFALIPAAGWLVWVRLNLECDFAQGRFHLDRPLFTFFKVLRDGLAGKARGSFPRVRAVEVNSGREPLASANPAGNDRLHPLGIGSPAPRAGTEPEWPDDVMPPVRRQG